MTKRFVTGLALLLLLQLSAGLVMAAPPSGGSTVRIVEDTTWSDAAIIDGRVEVASGATLTISAPHEMAEGASLDIEAGGSVIVQADLTSDGMRSGLLWSENGSLHIPTPQGHSGDLDVTIHLDSTVETANLTLGVRGETQQLVTGDSVSLTIASPDQNGTWLDLTPNPVLPKWVTHAVLTQSMQQLDAHELEHENGTRYWFESGWSLHVNGSILFQGVRVEGADATCWGTCDLVGSTMINSAPMHSRDDANITVRDSVFEGSRTDEDVYLHGNEPSISWTNSTGTGGTTDRWVRVLPQRILQAPLANISVLVEGIGITNRTVNTLSDVDGRVDLGLSEGHRTIEWMDASGEIGREDLSIEASLLTAWGTYSIVNTSAVALETQPLDFPLPYVSVDRVELNTNVTEVQGAVEVTIHASNSGSAPANARFECQLANGSQTDLGIIEIDLEATTGTNSGTGTWRPIETGTFALLCVPAPPMQFSDYGVVSDLTGATSIDVDVTDRVEEEDDATGALAIAVVIAVAIAAIGGAALLRRRT